MRRKRPSGNKFSNLFSSVISLMKLHPPLFIKIKPKACKNQGKERHKNRNGHRAAVGSGWNLGAPGGLYYVQT